MTFLRRFTRPARLLATYVTPFRLLMLGVFGGSLVGLSQLGWFGAPLSAVAATLVLAVLISQVQPASRQPVGSSRTKRRSDQPPPTDQGAQSGDSRPLVSVIVSGHDQALSLRDCIESLKVQTLSQFEVVVVDNGSTDDSLASLQRSIGSDRRFRVFHVRQRIGPGPARNFGLEQARADFVTFLELDELLPRESLFERLAAFVKRAGEPWVAGVYAIQETPGADVRVAPSRRSWLDRGDDNEFQLSALVLRKHAVRAVAGFRDVAWEDRHLWLTMLRAGFVFEGVASADATIGRKHRADRLSAALRTGKRSDDPTVDADRAQSRPDAVVGPFWYEQPSAQHRTQRAECRRLALELGNAVGRGDSGAQEDLMTSLRAMPPAILGWELDVAAVARASVQRVAVEGDDSPLRDRWEAEVDRLLEPEIEQARAHASAWLASQRVDLTPDADVIAVRRKRRVSVKAETLPSFAPGDRPFLLLPSAAYHTDELIDLVGELRHLGLSPIAMINRYRWTTTEHAMARVDVPVVNALPAGEWLHSFSGVFTFNDWGEYFGDYVQYVRDSNVPSFARVEGVQDWHDRDTGRPRGAYLNADVVLCQGQNDLDALEDRRGGLEIVGSDRLERVWRARLPEDQSMSVVANVNFTYDVLTEHRDMWVESVRIACDEAAVPFVLSVHPSETATFPGEAAADPLRNLLTEHPLLVSRFSTVLFEAMARGCGVAYHNPHNEEVETFRSQDPSYLRTRTVTDLADFIASEAATTRAERKERAARFFARQVSMIEGQPVAERTAHVVSRYLGDGP